MRDRPRFLPPLLQPLVIPVDIDESSRPRTPVLFWPLPAGIFPNNEMMEGRSTFFWKERISSSWGTYFVTYEKFLAASYRLEFLLEFNSHLATNSIKDQFLKDWLKAITANPWFSYIPDLFFHSLQNAVPMAERCYDVVVAQDSSTSPLRDSAFPLRLSL
jgi:hypothetical protein